MILKKRFESDELKVMNLLDSRMEFSEKDKQQHYNLRKGYEGEVHFDARMENIGIEHFTLNDLLLEVNNTLFQIDSTVIVQDTLYLFDVKNFEGDYYYEGDRLKKINGNEVKDPLLQLKRSNSLLRQLLDSLGFQLTIQAYAVFINPEFALYQAPKDAPIILPNQINRFLKKLNSKHSKLTPLHKKIGEKLLVLHKNDSPYTRVPQYEYDQLAKGIICGECHDFLDTIVKRDLVCNHCGSHEKIDAAVLRSVEELKFLFPERKIKTAMVYEWCNGALPLKTIRRILNANFKSIGERHTRHFL